MFSSKFLENKISNEKIKKDVKSEFIEKKKLKIKIPKINVSLNFNDDRESQPKIKHREIEINI